MSAAMRHSREPNNSTKAAVNLSKQSELAPRSYGTLQIPRTLPTEIVSGHSRPKCRRRLQYSPQGVDKSNDEVCHDINERFHGNEETDREAQYSEQADSNGLYPPNCTWTGAGAAPARADPFRNSKCDVWYKIHEIRKVVIECIDDPYSFEQLKSPKIHVSVVRPLVDRFYDSRDTSVVYCLLINRTQFIREQSYTTHHQSVDLTRALLCEILAEKVLRRHNENNPGPLGLLKLANILVAGFEPFKGAPEEIVKEHSFETGHTNPQNLRSHARKMTALEIAIVSESKSFLASSACQKVVDAIYCGKIVYTPDSLLDIIPDHWKKRPISLYDPRRGPLLNQYRLIVPRTRNIIEIAQFVTLLILYIIVMTGREDRQETKYAMMEAVFDVYASGWVLDQVASILEHGWQVYTQNLWSFLDVMFMSQFVVYFGLRLYGLYVDNPTDPDTQLYGKTALDVLSCAAPILVPRLAFSVMSDNMLFLSLRAMMGDFLILTALAIWCFGGFLFSLKWLHDGAHEPKTIGKWMIWIWFSLDGTGIDHAPDFHWLLGPVLMVTFAFLGPTFFLVILVSMLSNTFSTITANATQEIQYRRSVLTFMGVKADAIFAYLPPFNLLAIFLLLPMKFILTPRYFHKLNVVCARGLNMPLLVLIALYERRALWIPIRHGNFWANKIDWKNPNGPRALGSVWWSRTFHIWDVSKFSAHGDIQAVFDTEPPSFATPHQASEMDLNLTPPDADDDRVEESASMSDLPKQPNAGGRKPRQFRGRESLETAIGGHDWSCDRNFTSESEANGAYSPVLKRWLSRDRRESITDYDGDRVSTHETNAQLIRLEHGLERIESFLKQFLDNSSHDKSQKQEKLRVDTEAEGVQSCLL